MTALKGTKTHENLKHAFAAESQANRRYLYFARAADIEGYPEIGGLFRDTSEAETGHAFGHMDFLKSVGDPATDVAFGTTRQNLQSAIEGETYEYTQMYPGMARTAREEGCPRSRSGSRRWPRPSAATPDGSPRGWRTSRSSRCPGAPGPSGPLRLTRRGGCGRYNRTIDMRVRRTARLAHT